MTWYVDVDWDNDGAFEADEAGRTQALTVRRGREGVIRSDGKGFERAHVGQAVLTLDNFDGRYDPLDTGSALYPNVLPGREVRIRKNDGATTHAILRGNIEQIIPLGKRRGGLVRLVVADGWRWLRDRTVRKALQTSIRTDTALGHVLDSADWTAAWGRSLGVGSDTLPYWWADDQSAADAINDLNESEVGQFYVATSGSAVFTGRSALYNAAAAVNVTQSDLLDELLLPQPWEAVRNIIRVKCYPRTTQPVSELWRIFDTPLVNPGASLTVFAEMRSKPMPFASFQYSSHPTPATGVTCAATTDYTANTASDGSGTDLTANFTVAVTVFGTTAKLVVTNTGAQAGYVTLLRLRGQAIDAPEGTLIEVDGSAGSAYGPRALTLDLPWQQSVTSAVELATWLKSLFDDPLAFPTVQIEGRASLQFAYDLFTRVNLSVAALGISADYYIDHIEHAWQFATGEGVVTTWRLEPADSTAYWKFTTTLGVSSRFAY